MSSHLVKDLLQHKATIVFTTAPDATVQEPLELMVSKSISSLPVISQGEQVGIISERDYVRKAVPKRIVPWKSRLATS